MKKVYDTLQNFLDDVHEELNVKEMIISMGLMNEEQCYTVHIAHC